MRLLESVMFAVEGVNHIISINIDLVFHVDILFDKVNEFLHLLAE